MRLLDSPFAVRLPSDQTFFGLTPEYDKLVMDQCWELGYYGEGSLTMTEAYNLPINVRSYYYAKLVATKKAEAEAIEKAQKEQGRR